jgi:hypothetical protein
MDLLRPLPPPSARQVQASKLMAVEPYPNRDEARALYEPELFQLSAARPQVDIIAIERLYDEMRTLKIPPTIGMCNVLLAAAAPLAYTRLVDRLLMDIKTFVLTPTIDTYHALIRCYGRIPTTLHVSPHHRISEVWATVTRRGLLPTKSSFWCDLIDAIGRNRATPADLRLIRQQMDEFKVDGHVNIDCSLVEAYVRNARFVAGRSSKFESFQQTSERKGLVIDAINVIEQAIAGGRTPPMKTWRTFTSLWSLLGQDTPKVPVLSRVKGDDELAQLDKPKLDQFIAFIRQIKSQPLTFQ